MAPAHGQLRRRFLRPTALLLLAWAPAAVARAASAPRQLCACQREERGNGRCKEEVAELCARHKFGLPMCGYLAEDQATADAAFVEVMRQAAGLCRHPYSFNVTEVQAFLGAVGKPALKPAFLDHEIDGRTFTELSEQDMVTVGLKLGPAKEFYASKESFLAPSMPRQGTDPTALKTIQTSIIIKSVFQVDELNFDFHSEFTVVFHWSDQNLWTTCEEQDAAIDVGKCKYVWRPAVKFPNARGEDLAIDKRYLWADVEFQRVTYQLEVRGRFTAPMSFKTFPSDAQAFPITIALDGDLAIRNHIMLTPVTAKLGQTIQNPPDGNDVVSGWTVESATAHEHPTVHVEWAEIAGDAGPFRTFVDEMLARYKAQYGKELDINSSSEHSSATTKIKMVRTKSFYIVNYVLIIAILTSLSWVVFAMDPMQLNDRCAIAMTLLLALNVFQLILVEMMPKTGYLTDMHSFVLISTIYTFAAVLESFAVMVLKKRVAIRAAVIERMAKSARNGAHGWGVVRHEVATDKGRNASGATAVGGGGGIDSSDVSDVSEVIPNEPAAHSSPVEPSRAPSQRLHLLFTQYEMVLAEWLDPASLVLFPLTYCTYVAVVFG